MEVVFSYLKGEWLVVSQAPATFITGVFLVGLIVYGVVRHQFSDRLATLDKRIRLKDERLNEYASKLDGASPDEAKKRMDQLEARIQEVREEFGPRKLTPKQSDAIREIARRATGRIEIMTDVACADGPRLSKQFQQAFRDAGWEVSAGFVRGPGNPLLEGLAVILADDGVPATTALEALTETGLVFATRRRNADQFRGKTDAELLITAKSV
jgi:hypothetical protein